MASAEAVTAVPEPGAPGFWSKQWTNFRAGSLLDKFFWVSVFVKLIDGAAETIGGLALAVLRPDQIADIAERTTRHTLRHHPNSWWANPLLHVTNHLSGSETLFGAAYLILHGLVKVVLAWAVLREKLWAYPWMIAFLIAFIGYQGWEIYRHPHLWLILLTAFDIFLTWLTWLEYRRHLVARRQRRSREAAA